MEDKKIMSALVRLTEDAEKYLKELRDGPVETKTKGDFIWSVVNARGVINKEIEKGINKRGIQ